MRSPQTSSRASYLTVAVPIPVNLAAVLIAFEMVWKLWLGMSQVRGYGTVKLLRLFKL